MESVAVEVLRRALRRAERRDHCSSIGLNVFASPPAASCPKMPSRRHFLLSAPLRKPCAGMVQDTAGAAMSSDRRSGLTHRQEAHAFMRGAVRRWLSTTSSP